MLKFAAMTLSIAGFFAGPHAAFAQGSETAKLPPAAETATLTVPQSPSTFRGSSSFEELTFTFGQENYLSRDAIKSGTSSYTQISSHLRARTESKPLNGTLDIGGSFATDVENYSNIQVPEAFLNWEQEDVEVTRARIVVGRKLESWSSLDSDWDLGVVQPLNKFDALRSEEQGLTGAFVGWGRGGFDLVGYVSSVFIPEQGAPFELQNGTFSSNSPWFTAPPETLVLFEKKAKVNYKLQTPSIGSIINHPSAGFFLRVKDPTGPGMFAQASFLRKPRNTLSLPFDGKLRLENTTNYGDVNVYPEVTYHSIGALDLGYRSNAVSVTLAGLHEIPDTPDMLPSLTYQKLEPATLASPSVEVRTFPSSLYGPRVKLSYLKTWGGEATTVGEFASNGNVFGPSMPYRTAASLSERSILMRTKRYQLDQSIRWIEELEELGTVLSADVNLHIDAAWRITASGDFLGSRQETSKTDTFIARFRGNDRFAAKLTYIF
ncbi:MAG: hypothetical protein V4760_05385 [Bdellovibrionota bacterium]